MITCYNGFNVWPKTTFFLLLWPRDAKRLDTPSAKPALTSLAMKALHRIFCQYRAVFFYIENLLFSVATFINYLS